MIESFGQNSSEKPEVITLPDPADPANTTKITSRHIYALCNPKCESSAAHQSNKIFCFLCKNIHMKHFHPDKNISDFGILKNLKINLYTTDFWKKNSSANLLMYFGKQRKELKAP